MSSFNFITVRLGKDSLPDIKMISSSEVGVLTNTFTINVKCTQIPDNYKPGDYAFIWLGSDNNKGMPTKWKQGFKAVGRVNSIARGKSYNDTSETVIEIVYVFHDAINRLDILRCAPVAYYWCSSLPLIGIDDHANQTIRSMVNSVFSDLRAFFTALESVSNSFRDDIVKIEPGFINYFAFYLPNPKKYPFAKNLDELDIDNSTKPLDNPLQQIFYGAPGTGKSHRIKEIIRENGIDEKEQVIRTTFHPDSDYSTFVGCYKPIMKSVPQTYVVEGKEKPVIDIATSQQSRKDEIVYDYTPQAFVQAYTKAWTTNKPVILVIEEINRGNCAQIFGDIFQLLDRGDDGVSEYEIKPDKALENYLRDYFADFGDVDEQIRSGKIMKLPANLYIWATMNTSDQSLFPIDSAFKRRWEWKYMPINNHENKGYQIEIGNAKYDWWGFLARINHVINDTTNSEDKKLGYFFAKAQGKTIDAEQFVGKVLFYLWNDVFKSYGFDDPIFSKGDNKKFEFSDFFMNDGNTNTDTVNLFLRKLEETIKMEELPMEIKPNLQDDGQGE